MIVLQSQAYCVTGLPKYFSNIPPHGICASEGHKVTFIYHFHDEYGRYLEIRLKEENPGLHTAEHVEMVNIKYHQNNNLPTHETLLPNKI